MLSLEMFENPKWCHMVVFTHHISLHALRRFKKKIVTVPRLLPKLRIFQYYTVMRTLVIRIMR